MAQTKVKESNTTAKNSKRKTPTARKARTSNWDLTTMWLAARNEEFMKNGKPKLEKALQKIHSALVQTKDDVVVPFLERANEEAKKIISERLPSHTKKSKKVSKSK